MKKISFQPALWRGTRAAIRQLLGFCLLLAGFGAAHAQSSFILNPLQIKSGVSHSCALTATGGVKCWGRNDFGQLGDGTLLPRTGWVDVAGLSSGVVAIDTNVYHTCAVLATGAAKCWGANTEGQLGDGTVINRSSPVQVTGLTSGVTAISVSDTHSCAVVGGNVKCWGLNADGQLGNNSTVSSSIPVDVAGLSGVTALAAGGSKRPVPVAGVIQFSYGNHTCALLTGGSVKCWGANSYAQLGYDGPDGSLAPVTVAGITGAVELVSGIGHSCARNSAGAVNCWGLIEYPKIPTRGLVIYTKSIGPITITGLSSGVTSISTGRTRTCAASSAGVKCWGQNLEYDLFYSITSPPSGNPLPATEFEAGVSRIAAGDVYGTTTSPMFNRPCFIASNGRTKCLGEYAGDGSTIPRTIAVDVVVNPLLPTNSFFRLTSDQNTDGTSDILFSDAPGALSVAYTQATTVTKAVVLPAGSGWTATHSGDLDGDGKLDFIARKADGTIATFLTGVLPVPGGATLLSPGSPLSVTLLGDFNADGRADIVFTHTDGSVIINLSDGFTSRQILGPSSPWRVKKAADFNADGKTDLLIDQADGTTAILMMDGATVTNAAVLLTSGSGWTVTHVADFNGDFKSDLVIRNTNGSTALLQMDGVTVTSAAFLTLAGSPWTVSHTGDFNGDGKKDIVLTNTDGSVVLLQMNGLTVQSAAFLLLAGNTRTVAQIGDYNGDGKQDILLKNTDGTYTVVLMNGATVTGSGTYSLGTLVPLPY
jgi:alpha-tubulin suppressor-like RCC1 family protein